MKLPETWSTSARLLVESPQIPDNMVASTIQTDAIEQLDIIQQKLLTRANLIDIANKFQVFPTWASFSSSTPGGALVGADTETRFTSKKLRLANRPLRTSSVDWPSPVVTGPSTSKLPPSIIIVPMVFCGLLLVPLTLVCARRTWLALTVPAPM